MKRLCAIFAALVTACSAEEGFVPMFNGRDLEGWVNVNGAPETWSVHDGVIACTGRPTGALRTARQYENFIMEVEWRHLTSGGNSGVFIWGSPIAAPGVPFLRGIEVQVLDHGYAEQYEKRTGKKSESFTTHGDVFPIHGATMTPLAPTNGKRGFPREERSRRSPEWNHYRIECQAGSIRLHVNGKEVSGGDNCVYRKGYLALESEGAPVEFRNARIKELPASGATVEQTAPIAQGHRPLYNGLDLRGWKTGLPERWQSHDWRLILANGEAGEPLWTAEEFGDCELIVDVKIAAQTARDFAVHLRGSTESSATISLPELTPRGAWHRVILTIKNCEVIVVINDREIRRQQLPANIPPRGAIGFADIGGGLELTNILVREF